MNQPREGDTEMGQNKQNLALKEKHTRKQVAPIKEEICKWHEVV